MYDTTGLCNKYDDDDLDTKQENNYSHKIIRLAELLVGERIANIFAEKGYPCLYRVHHIDEKEKKNLEKVVKGLRETYGSNQIDSLNSVISGLIDTVIDKGVKYYNKSSDIYEKIYNKLGGNVVLNGSNAINISSQATQNLQNTPPTTNTPTITQPVPAQPTPVVPAQPVAALPAADTPTLVDGIEQGIAGARETIDELEKMLEPHPEQQYSDSNIRTF